MAQKANLRYEIRRGKSMIHPGVGNPKVNELASGVFAFTKLVHFFADIGVNAGIIETKNSVVFIDSGMSAYTGEYLWKFAEENMDVSDLLFRVPTLKFDVEKTGGLCNI